MDMFRQGDILLMKVNEHPEGKTIRRTNGRIIIAQGEATGHHHAVATIGVKMIEAADIRYLVSTKPFEVVHEEHAAIPVPAGVYKIIRQRQYTPEAIVQVRD